MEPPRSHVLMHAGMDYRWESGEEAGDVPLEVTPRRLHPLLTWRLWTVALTWMVSFVEEDPHMLVAFEMIWSSLDGREDFLGIGDLSLYWANRVKEEFTIARFDCHLLIRVLDAAIREDRSAYR